MRMTGHVCSYPSSSLFSFPGQTIRSIPGSLVFSQKNRNKDVVRRPAENKNMRGTDAAVPWENVSYLLPLLVLMKLKGSGGGKRERVKREGKEGEVAKEKRDSRDPQGTVRDTEREFSERE
jgi:hypothetical protein